MSEVDQLEERIENPSRELAKFRAWFVEFDARVWGRPDRGGRQAASLMAASPKLVPTIRLGRPRAWKCLTLAAVLGRTLSTLAEGASATAQGMGWVRRRPHESAGHANCQSSPLVGRRRPCSAARRTSRCDTHVRGTRDRIAREEYRDNLAAANSNAPIPARRRKGSGSRHDSATHAQCRERYSFGIGATEHTKLCPSP